MPYYDRSILVQNIRSLMEQEHITQEKLGEILGMSQSNLSKALNLNEKKNFTVEQLVDISNHFHVSIDKLIGGHSSSTMDTSPRSVAAFIAELIANHDAKLFTMDKEEQEYAPNWNYQEQTMDYSINKKSVRYPCIYFPSYWYPDRDQCATDEDYFAICSEAEQCGNDTRMLPVNEFLHRFHDIFKIYDKHGLEADTYETVVQDLLSHLRSY